LQESEEDGGAVGAGVCAVGAARAEAETPFMGQSAFFQSDALFRPFLVFSGDWRPHLRRHCGATFHGLHHRRTRPPKACGIHAVPNQRSGEWENELDSSYVLFKADARNKMWPNLR